MDNRRVDYYKVLGVETTASGDEIHQAYKQLAMQHHPDRNLGDDTATSRFQELQEAYDVLSNPKHREIHDWGNPDFSTTQFTPAEHKVVRTKLDASDATGLAFFHVIKNLASSLPEGEEGIAAHKDMRNAVRRNADRISRVQGNDPENTLGNYMLISTVNALHECLPKSGEVEAFNDLCDIVMENITGKDRISARHALHEKRPNGGKPVGADEFISMCDDLLEIHENGEIADGIVDLAYMFPSGEHENTRVRDGLFRVFNHKLAREESFDQLKAHHAICSLFPNDANLFASPGSQVDVENADRNSSRMSDVSVGSGSATLSEGSGIAVESTARLVGGSLSDSREAYPAQAPTIGRHSPSTHLSSRKSSCSPRVSGQGRA